MASVHCAKVAALPGGDERRMLYRHTCKLHLRRTQPSVANICAPAGLVSSLYTTCETSQWFHSELPFPYYIKLPPCALTQFPFYTAADTTCAPLYAFPHPQQSPYAHTRSAGCLFTNHRVAYAAAYYLGRKWTASPIARTVCNVKPLVASKYRSTETNGSSSQVPSSKRKTSSEVICYSSFIELKASTHTPTPALMEAQTLQNW